MEKMRDMNGSITLIRPPSPYLADDRAQPPSGLMYLAAVLEAAGVQVKIEDLAGHSDWEERVRHLDSAVFGVSCATPDFPVCKRISELLPGQSLKIAGGPHPTFLPEETLRNTSFDIAVRREGELVLPRILRDLKNGVEPDRIYDGDLVDLGSLPLPARHLVDLDSYRPEMEGNATTIFTSRGCPCACSFCCKITGNRVRFRNAEDVVGEIELVAEEYGFRDVIFEDDNFCVNRERVLKICGMIRNMGLRIRICPRADSVDEEMLKVLGEAGVREISYGVESGSQRMLDLMNKRTSVETNRRAIRMARDAGMITKIYIIVGFPGETDESVEETMRFVEDEKPDKWLLQNFIPYPGTDVWDRPEEYGVTWISRDYGDFFTVGKGGHGGRVFRTQELNEDRIAAMHDRLYDFLMDYKPMHRG